MQMSLQLSFSVLHQKLFKQFSKSADQSDEMQIVNILMLSQVLEEKVNLSLISCHRNLFNSQTENEKMLQQRHQGSLCSCLQHLHVHLISFCAFVKILSFDFLLNLIYYSLCFWLSPDLLLNLCWIACLKNSLVFSHCWDSDYLCCCCEHNDSVLCEWYHHHLIQADALIHPWGIPSLVCLCGCLCLQLWHCPQYVPQDCLTELDQSGVASLHLHCLIVILLVDCLLLHVIVNLSLNCQILQCFCVWSNTGQHSLTSDSHHHDVLMISWQLHDVIEQKMKHADECLISFDKDMIHCQLGLDLMITQNSVCGWTQIRSSTALYSLSSQHHLFQQSDWICLIVSAEKADVDVVQHECEAVQSDQSDLNLHDHSEKNKIDSADVMLIDLKDDDSHCDSAVVLHLCLILCCCQQINFFMNLFETADFLNCQQYENHHLLILMSSIVIHFSDFSKKEIIHHQTQQSVCLFSCSC